ncbi:MAG: 6-phosphofructokinase [Mahellales bacterium]|jgi:6-phosphofructokinase
MHLKGNCIIGQSGGPTAVINASLYGIINEATKSSSIHKIYGARNGILGVLKEDFIDMTQMDSNTVEKIRLTPASALGTCRFRLQDPSVNKHQYDRILEVFSANNIRYFFYIGGNDSMDTVQKIDQYAKEVGYPLSIIGVPKTVDNDLNGTDHCPGFGSAAKYIITSIIEAMYDCKSYDDDTILIVEVMGRDAGWLAAASALIKDYEDFGPDFIYLPETIFCYEKFINNVKNLCTKKKNILIVAAEGIKDNLGRYISSENASNFDGFKHKALGGVSQVLKGILQDKITKRIKTINLGLLQRCSMHMASLVDFNEAQLVGEAAVKYALKGETGKMVGIKRLNNSPYSVEPCISSLERVANHIKKVPVHWVCEKKNNIKDDCLEYFRPLVQGYVPYPNVYGIPQYMDFNSKSHKYTKKEVV